MPFRTFPQGSSSRRARSVGGRRGGFTLIEMLVIMGIILVLLSILLPSIGRAWRVGKRTRMALDLETISNALVNYRQDHRDIPRLYPTGGNVNQPHLSGARVLCRALIAPEPAAVDGQDGPGFRTQLSDSSSGRTVQQGRVYGPYVPADSFKISANYEIHDRYGRPILYYPGNKSSDIHAANGYVAAGTYGLGAGNDVKPLYNATDNIAYMEKLLLQMFLGDKNKNGSIDGDESPAWTGDFLLWSAGPDQQFGPDDKNRPVSLKNRCDDVTNYGRSETQ